jgi:hypothetical protein
MHDQTVRTAGHGHPLIVWQTGFHGRRDSRGHGHPLIVWQTGFLQTGFLHIGSSGRRDIIVDIWIVWQTGYLLWTIRELLNYAP